MTNKQKVRDLIAEAHDNLVAFALNTGSCIPNLREAIRLLDEPEPEEDSELERKIGRSAEG